MKQEGANKYEAAKDAAAQKQEELKKSVGDKMAEAGEKVKNS